MSTPVQNLKKQLRLIEVSAVTFPAYETASVALRDRTADLARLERARLRLPIARAW